MTAAERVLLRAMADWMITVMVVKLDQPAGARSLKNLLDLAVAGWEAEKRREHDLWAKAHPGKPFPGEVIPTDKEYRHLAGCMCPECGKQETVLPCGPGCPCQEPEPEPTAKVFGVPADELWLCRLRPAEPRLRARYEPIARVTIPS